LSAAALSIAHYQEKWLEEDNSSWLQAYSCYLDD